MTCAASAARAAHFRRQQADSRSLLAGMAAEREVRVAAAVLADLAAAIDRSVATRAP